MGRLLKRTLAVAGVVLLGGLGLPLGWYLADPAGAIRTSQAWMIDAALGSPDELELSTGPLACWEVGSGPTVVLIHGFGDSASGWVPVARALASEHHVVTFDLPAHGRSAPADRAVTFDELLASVDAVVAGQQGPVDLVGNSLGGWLALAFTLAHPEQVRSLTLVNNGGFERELDVSELLPDNREAVQDKVVAVMGEHARPIPGLFADGMIALHADPRLHGLFTHLVDEAPYFDGQLAGTTVPLLLLWGTPDPWFPAEGYRSRIEAERPDATVVQLDGCGHAPQYSCAGAMVTALEAWLHTEHPTITAPDAPETAPAPDDTRPTSSTDE